MVALSSKAAKASLVNSWKILAENVLLKRWKGKMLEACKTGKSQIVKLLFEKGANVDVLDSDQQTVIHRVEFVQILIQHGAEVNSKDGN